MGRHLALFEIIKLDWEGLPGTNTLAYYKNSKITFVKSFLTLGQGVNVTKLFSSSLSKRPNKLERLSMAIIYNLVQHFQVRMEPIQVEHLSGPPL